MRMTPSRVVRAGNALLTKFTHLPTLPSRRDVPSSRRDWAANHSDPGAGYRKWSPLLGSEGGYPAFCRRPEPTLLGGLGHLVRQRCQIKPEIELTRRQAGSIFEAQLAFLPTGGRRENLSTVFASRAEQRRLVSTA
jgi:hypothetical protein